MATSRAANILAALALAVLAAPAFAQRAGNPQRVIDEQDRRVRAGERETATERQDSSDGQAGPASAPALDRAARADRRRIIEALEARIGGMAPNSPQLIEPLTTLGALYGENGDPVRASAAIRRALEVVRFNEGLHTLEQAPLIRQLIVNARAMGDAVAAWELEQELLVLAGRHPDDLGTARILRDTADARMDVLERYNAGEIPPEIALGCYYGPPEDSVAGRQARADGGAVNCEAGSRRNVKARLLTEAQFYYAQSINIVLRNEHYSGDELPELLEDLVASSHRYGDEVMGRRGLRYLLGYQATTSAPWLTRIQTLVRIADWDLLYAEGSNDYESALEEYAEAYAALREKGIAQDAIDELFSPSLPVTLPGFLPNPLRSDPGRAAGEYIDIAFEITRYGKGRNVRILDATGNVTRVDERRLIQFVLRSRFRPRLTDGRFIDSGPSVVRYYLSP